MTDMDYTIKCPFNGLRSCNTLCMAYDNDNKYCKIIHALDICEKPIELEPFKGIIRCQE